MKQLALFPELISNTPKYPKAVNVASVPQRSPFRYPGGKTWFVPTFRKWMVSKPTKPALLIEPFAGGGIISLTALFENFVDMVLMVELDEQVAAVWQTIVDGNAQWLAEQILKFNLTYENIKSEINKVYEDTKYIAFQTILKNRTFHGGILAKGSGLLKNGEQGKGIHSRWYPETLAKRLQYINLIAKRIDFRKGNGLDVILENALRTDVVYFIDPPYTAGGKKAGKRLYKYCELDHERLFKICEEVKGDFVMTYDNAEEVKDLARRHRFEMKAIAMRNTHHAEMTELIISKDLSWLLNAPKIHEAQKSYPF